jgi:polysaccharide pyruvyl transferase CsaB
MTRVLISGYYGFDNAGDDTVLYGIINSLKKQLPTIDIAVLSNKPKETEALFGIAAYNRWRFSEIIKQLKQSDLLLMGGGSLLQDATSPRSVIYYLGIVTIAKLLNKPVIFFAQGFGPISHQISKTLIRMVVNKVDVITVRDERSAEDMQQLGVTRPIQVTADPAVTIDPRHVDLTLGQKHLVVHPHKEQRSVAISIRPWKNEQAYKKEIAKMADELITKGWTVYFLPMQFPSDIAPSEDIRRHMKETGVVLLNEKMSFHEIISFIGNMDFVIGMRLHSIIIAAVLGIPCVGISYDPKIDRFLDRVGLDVAGKIQSLTYQELSETVNKNLNQLDDVKRNLEGHMQVLVQQAELSSQLAIDLLNQNQHRKM